MKTHTVLIERLYGIRKKTAWLPAWPQFAGIQRDIGPEEDYVLGYDPPNYPVPAIPSELKWVVEKEVMGITHHRSVQWSDGYFTEVLYVTNRR